jgi:CheY-like chemotaxis protein
MDGYETCRRLRQACGSAPSIVALTGWGQEQDKRMATEAGFDEHWTKPVDPERLQALT